MERIQLLFLQALKAALKNESVDWSEEITQREWNDLFRLSSEHQVLPMIFQAVFSCNSAQSMDPGFRNYIKRQTMQMVMMQTMKTAEFISMYSFLRSKGLNPRIVKGIVCRNMYPNPDYRISGDEDMLIEPGTFTKAHEAMLEFGMVLADPSQEIEKVYEVPYGKPGSPIHIEMHKSLFPPDSEAYGEFNRYFEHVHEEYSSVTAEGTEILTLAPTDHLFYLITHAFKHFLHGGFGLRQVCDIILFAETYGNEIKWSKVLQNCREVKADQFTAALFEIGRNHLVFDEDKACLTKEWKQMKVDETMMLEDLLASGIYGGSTMSRKHSSNITLDAIAAEKQGKKKSSGLMKSLFPSRKALENKYTYLKKFPFLLPVAWTQRILRYRQETKASNDNSAAEALKIGNERIALMKEYGILKK